MSDQSLIPPEENPLQISPVPLPLTVEYIPRRVRMIQLSSHELDTVASSSVNLAFFCLSAGASITVTVVLTTVKITDPKTYGGYIAALIASGIFSLYFGILAVKDHRKAKKKLDDLKAGRSSLV